MKEILKNWYRFLSPKFQNLFLEYKVDFKPRYGHGKPPHPQLYDVINGRRAEYGKILEAILKYKNHIQSIKKCEQENDQLNPCWNNGFFPGLDMAALYSMIPLFQPNKYVEVGSGNSTKVARKAIQDHQLATRIISIDPYPRVEIDQISDENIRLPFESLDLASFPELEANDILFIDNSHRALPNSDATVFFLEVFPLLKKGVIVHVHDIYLPYDYPQFMCDRFYSEQYMLAAFLLANAEKYQPLLPNYFISEDQELSEQLQALWEHPNLDGVERHGGSFWLRIA